MNNIATINGGTHVLSISTVITDNLKYVLAEQNIQANLAKLAVSSSVRKNHVLKNVWIFVNANVDNPIFDSIAKEALTTDETTFWSSCHLSRKILDEGMHSF